MGFERIVPGTIEWDTYHGNHLARYLFAVEILRKSAPKQILDAACGVGYGTKHLAEAIGAKVVGVDRSDEALSIAKSQFAHPNVTFRSDDCHTLEAAAEYGPFDAVVSMETFEHLPKPMDFLGAVRRLLNSGGQFIVSTPNAEEFSNAGEWEFHVKEYTAVEFQTMLIEAGFTSISIFGQRLTDRGKDRADVRAEIGRLTHNPFMRFGRFLQRTLRGRKSDMAILPERPDDFHFATLASSSALNEAATGCEALVGVATR